MYFDEYEMIRITPYSSILLVYKYFMKYMYVHEYVPGALADCATAVTLYLLFLITCDKINRFSI